MELKGFWTWFDGSRRWLREVDCERAQCAINSAVAEIDPRLGAECCDSVGAREVIFTAHGISDVFDLVRTVVGQAPVIPGWIFHALKPPRGFDFVLESGTDRLEAALLAFDPLESPEQPGQLGIRVYLPTGCETTELSLDLVRLAVETGLGEEKAAQLSHIQVSAAHIDPDEPLPINSLRDYIDWHFRRTSPREEQPDRDDKGPSLA